MVGNGPGFVGNRMMFPYMYETQFMVEEGATPEQVDAALTGFGMAMGMFAVDDMAGIDVAIRAQQALGHFTQPGERRPLVQIVCWSRPAGWARRPARVGTPTATTGSRNRMPTVVDLIRAQATAAGIPQRSFSDEDIVERAIYALINEGARVLEAGLALRASDIDTIYVNGYGFPGVARRPDVLRRSRRAGSHLRPRLVLPPGVRSTLDSGSAAGAARARGHDVSQPGPPARRP